MSESINFSVIPTGQLRTRGVFAEVNASLANTGQQALRALVIGQVGSNATLPSAALNIPVLSTGAGNAATLYGSGSPLADMVAAFRKQNAFAELWELPLAASGSGLVAGGKTITFAGNSNLTGVLPIYIAGQILPLVINAGDTPSTMATNFNALVAGNTVPDVPMTAGTPSGGAVTLTPIWAGSTGNDVDVRVSYRGHAGGELVPADFGITVTIANATTPGSGTPSLTAALANIPASTSFDAIGCSLNDSVSIAALTAFLNDTTGRWSWTQELFGHAFYGFRGTLGSQAAFCTNAGLNDQHATVVPFYDSPTSPWVIMADALGLAMTSASADAALPIEGQLLSTLAPPAASRYSISSRNTLLFDGMSTLYVDDFGGVFVDRLITTYTKNAAGAVDASYLPLERMFQLSQAIRDMRTYLQTVFYRKVLVSDGTRISAGSNRVTSKTVISAANARYITQCNEFGWCQNPQQFIANSAAQNAGNGLVKLLLPYDLANQLNDIAMLIQFTSS